MKNQYNVNSCPRSRSTPSKQRKWKTFYVSLEGEYKNENLSFQILENKREAAEENSKKMKSILLKRAVWCEVLEQGAAA